MQKMKVESPENARNQSSLDRINNLPKTPAERKRFFDAGLKEIKRQGLLTNGITVVERLDEILIGKQTPYGGYEYQSPTKDPQKALGILKANPKWFAADGVYNGKGVLTIYATATSSGTALAVYSGTLLEMRRRALPFPLRLTSIENVIQTLAHEIGHHKGFNHRDKGIYDAEYLAVKAYRSK